MRTGSRLMLSVGLAVSLATQGFGQTTSSGATLDSLFVLPEGVETRWSSPENWKGGKGQAAQSKGGRKGSPAFKLAAGETRTLAEVSGRSGTIRRIWITINERDAAMLRGVRIDMYWDSADKPAVSAPLGDFFCHGLGRMATFQNALFSSPEGRSFNCCIPMPFKTGMKVTATNESGRDLRAFFFDVDYTLGDKHPDNTLYFHAHFRRENPTTMQEDYELLPKVSGRGRFLGVNIGVIPATGKYLQSWWGEGEVKVYLDGDEEFPTLSGTGTEDYIGTGWGQGQYATLYQGCHVADREKFQYCFYRLHIPDPVYFRQDVRVTIQQIGYMGGDVAAKLKEKNEPIIRAGPGQEKIDWSKEGGYSGLFERQDDWSSCAYFYLDRPTNGLPPLQPFEQRVAGLK